jgi:hypothetical protein
MSPSDLLTSPSVRISLNSLHSQLSDEKRRFMRDLHVRTHSEQAARKVSLSAYASDHDAGVREAMRLDGVERVQ